MTAVNLLEENWISIQETFELVSRVLSRLFVRLWPKKRAAVPKDNLSDLAKSLDTTEDPTLQLKGLSIKRGAEGAIALSLAHGTNFDWERVSSPHGHTRDQMKAFFEKAKKLAPALLMTISPWQLLRCLSHHLQQRKIQCHRRLPARKFPCPLLPWNTMLRWRRLGFLCSF
jgi:hypothetical protein